jgi:two-component system LytT family response regulator
MKKMLLNDHSGTHVVDLKDIVYCEAQDCYSVFHLNNGERKLVCKTLKEFEKGLDRTMFLRVHRKYIINMDHIKDRSGNKVLMTNNITIEISVRKKKEFIQRFSQYIKGS